MSFLIRLYFKRTEWWTSAKGLVLMGLFKCRKSYRGLFFPMCSDTKASPFTGDCKETFMLHKSPEQHSTTSSGVGGLLQCEDPSSLATMQPFWRTDVPFSIEREVKHCWPKHRSPLLQDVPSHKHSEFLTPTSPAQEKKKNRSERTFISKVPPNVLWQQVISAYPSCNDACISNVSTSTSVACHALKNPPFYTAIHHHYSRFKKTLRDSRWERDRLRRGWERKKNVWKFVLCT